MIYRGFLGQDLTPEEKSVVDPIVSQLKVIWQNMGPQAVINATLTEWNKAAKLAEQAVSGGELFATEERMTKVFQQYYFCRAAQIYGPLAWPQVVWAEKYPSVVQGITAAINRFKRAADRLAKFNPGVAKVGAALRRRQQIDAAAGNLDSGYVGISMKMAIIRMAYENPNDPRFRVIREKYNADGTSKTGVAAITTEGVKAAIASEFAKAGVAQPWAYGAKVVSPWVDPRYDNTPPAETAVAAGGGSGGGSSGGGGSGGGGTTAEADGAAGGGGMIAALAAAALAFFALR